MVRDRGRMSDFFIAVERESSNRMKSLKSNCSLFFSFSISLVFTRANEHKLCALLCVYIYYKCYVVHTWDYKYANACVNQWKRTSFVLCGFKILTFTSLKCAHNFTAHHHHHRTHIPHVTGAAYGHLTEWNRECEPNMQNRRHTETVKAGAERRDERSV